MPLAPLTTAKAFLGIAKETTKGTPVASTKFFAYNRDSFKYTPGQVLLEDRGNRGAPGDVYNMVAGVNWAEVAWNGNVIPDTIAWMLAGLFGESAVTGTNPYTHVFSLLNSGTTQPPAYTINNYYGAENIQIPGVQFSELTLSWTAEGLFTYSTKGIGYPHGTASAPTPSYSVQPPLAGWQCAATIGGAVSAAVLSGEVSVKRNVSRIHTGDSTSGAPAAVWDGNMMLDGKLQLVMENTTEINRLRTPATTTVDLNFDKSSTARVDMLMSKAQYTSAEPDLGKDWVELPVNFKALMNTTDVGASAGYGPGKVTVVNTLPGTGWL